MTAADYLDYELKALKPVQRYSGDLITVVDTIPAGSIVGKIYSWVTDKSGNTWWMLYDTWKPGFNMYVKHDATALTAIEPSGTNVTVTTPGLLTDLLGNNPLTSFSNLFKSATGTIVVAAIAYFFLTRKK